METCAVRSVPGSSDETEHRGVVACCPSTGALKPSGGMATFAAVHRDPAVVTAVQAAEGVGAAQKKRENAERTMTALNTSTIESRCNLCSRKWLFVAATDRSGSTTIMNMLNQIPGFRIHGENRDLITGNFFRMKQQLHNRMQEGAACKTGCGTGERLGAHARLNSDPDFLQRRGRPILLNSYDLPEMGWS